MLYIERAFRNVKHHYWLWLIPFAIAMFSYFWALGAGLWPLVQPGLHFKFAIPNGLPEMSQVLQARQVPLTGGSSLAIVGGLAGLVSLCISAYVSGGWFTGIFRLLQGETVSTDDFVQGAAKHFLALLFVRLANLLALIVIILPLGMIFPPFALLAILFIMAITFFWEISIVRDNLGLASGFTKSYEIVKSNVSEALSLALVLGVVTLCISPLINLLAQSMLTYPVASLAWSFVATVFAVAVSYFYLDHSISPN